VEAGDQLDTPTRGLLYDNLNGTMYQGKQLGYEDEEPQQGYEDV
jgi:hypothetical protein